MDEDQLFVSLLVNVYPVQHSIIPRLTNRELKSLRLTCRALSATLFPFMFRRLYVSSHETDLAVFNEIANHPEARWFVEELVWDDLSIGCGITEENTYEHNLRQRIERRMLPAGFAEDVYRYAVSQFNSIATGEATDAPLKTVLQHLKSFPLLSRFVFLDRSRYRYSSFWQTPRYRQWRKQKFFPSLPRPYPRCIHSTTFQQRVTSLLQSTSSPIQLKPGCQTALQFSSMQVTGLGPHGQAPIVDSRNDLKEKSIEKDGMHLIIHAYVKDANTPWPWNLQQNGELNSVISIRSLHLSSLQLEWLHNRATQIAIKYLGSLRTLMITDCCLYQKQMIDIFVFLRDTSVASLNLCNIAMGTDLEITWPSVLREVKARNINFEYFEISSCRLEKEFGPPGAHLDVDESAKIPWNGRSEDIVPWLNGETDEFPLWQDSSSTSTSTAELG